MNAQDSRWKLNQAEQREARRNLQDQWRRALGRDRRELWILTIAGVLVLLAIVGCVILASRP